MRILFLAGGSGGHIFPALAVASELRQKIPNAEIRFFCGRSALDQKILRENGENFTPIFAGKLRRYFSWQNFIDPFFLLFGFFQSLFLLIKWRPDAIFSKGGFVALPPIFAATILRIPILAHETDAAPGIANRISKRLATKFFSAFDDIGNPVREAIFHPAGRGKNIPFFSNSNQPLVFGFFGSQGAQRVNELFFEIADEIPANVVWVVGAGNLPKKVFPENIRFFEFIGAEFSDVLAAADLVVARSGGGVFEIAAAEKAALLIPLSTAANDHQNRNAERLLAKNAAEVLDETTASAEDFLQKIILLLNNPSRRETLRKNIAAFSPAGAAARLAEEVIDLVEKHF